MRRFAAIAVVFLVICWTAAPLLACMIPDRAMTAPEMECCKHMAQMCGSANMPQSHSCCKTEVRPGTTMVVTHNQQVRPILQVVVALPVPILSPCSNRFHNNTSGHPPNEYLPKTTVLRV
jgi:hypothetical protein